MEEEMLDAFKEELPNQVDYVSMIRRFRAMLIDIILLAVVTTIINYYARQGIVGLLLSMLSSVINFLYKVFLEKQFGQTIGKKIVGIAVVREDLRRISWQQALTRNYYYVICALVIIIHDCVFYLSQPIQPVFVGVTVEHGYVSYILFVLTFTFVVDCFTLVREPKNQTLHDKWAKTVVVKKSFLIK